MPDPVLIVLGDALDAIAALELFHRKWFWVALAFIAFCITTALLTFAFL